MLDPSIITRGAERAQAQQQNMWQDMGALAQLVGARTLQGRTEKMRQMPNPEDRQSFANNSIFSPYLNNTLRQDAATKLKAEQDALKFNADLNNTNAQTAERYANAGGTAQKTANAQLDTAKRAIFAGANNGNPLAIKMGLDSALAAGAISSQTYDSYVAQLESVGSNPSAVSEWAKSEILANSNNPAAFTFQTMDNAANNAQSDINNQRSNETSRLNNKASVEATMRGQDIGAATAAANRQQQLTIEQARIKMQQEGGSVQVFGGKAYFIDKQGNARPVNDENGQHLTAPQKGAETPIQRMEREAKVENFSSAAAQALEAAKNAEKIANDPNLRKAAGGWGIMARVPGTDARAMAKQIETLQSQVFLNQVEKMRGLGALTDFEGKKLESAIASLDINLDAKTLANNLSEISRIMQQSAQKSQNLAKIYSGDEVANPFMSGQQEQKTQQSGKPNARSFFD